MQLWFLRFSECDTTCLIGVVIAFALFVGVLSSTMFSSEQVFDYEGQNESVVLQSKDYAENAKKFYFVYWLTRACIFLKLSEEESTSEKSAPATQEKKTKTPTKARKSAAAAPAASPEPVKAASAKKERAKTPTKERSKTPTKERTKSKSPAPTKRARSRTPKLLD